MDDVTYLPANELHCGLEIKTVRAWREVAKVDRVPRGVKVTLDTGLTMIFSPNQMFRTRKAAT